MVPKSPRLHQRRVLGYLLIALGVVASILGMGEAFMVIPLGEDDAETYFEKLPDVIQAIVLAVPDGTPLIVLMLPGVALAAAGMYLIRRGRRHLVSSFDVSEPHAITEPILYLRPFTADASLARSTSIFGRLFGPFLDKWDRTWASLPLHGVDRYEELLAYAFRRVGAVVTIGDPRESLPLLGAARIYAVTPSAGGSADEEAWKREVGAQIKNARLVLLHIGSSEGLRWEIAQVVARADARRVVLCVNPPGKLKPSLPTLRKAQAEARRAWSEFRKACGAEFPRGLPDEIGDVRFVRFEKDWTPKPVERPERKLFWFLPGKSPDFSRNTVESVLAWLAWLFVPESPRRRVARRLVNYLSFLVAVIAGVVLLVFVLVLVMGAFQ